MTVINPNSISGITSITLPSGDSNVLTIHTNDGTERFRIDSSGNVKVGSACTISQDGDVFFTGVTTATTFTGAHSGSGANLTSLPAGNLTGALPAISGANLTGIAATDNVRTGILDVAGVSTFRNTMNVGAAVTISESGIEASGIGITVANINGTQIGGRRNLIINGAMQVAQRTTSSSGSSTTLTYICDRFFIYADNTDQASFTRAQVSDAPTGFSKSFKVSVDTAETTLDANEALQVAQRIEAQDLQHLDNGSATAKTVTLSFYVKSYQTGTFNVNLYKPDNTVRHISATYTVNQSATWEKKTITFAGDTAGGGIDDDNGNGLTLYWHLAAGSDYTSADSTSWGNYSAAGFAYGQAVNVMSSTNNYWQITGVQLEVGSQATAFEHRSYSEELLLCQRYYEVLVSGSGKTFGGIASMYSNSETHHQCQWHDKRTTPTLDYVSGSNYYTFYGNGTNTSVNGFSQFLYAHEKAGGIVTTVSTVFVQGGAVFVYAGNASSYVAVTAEL